MFTTLKFATDANSPKGFTGVCVGVCACTCVCMCLLGCEHNEECLCSALLFYFRESLFCLHVCGCFHTSQREGPQSPPIPLETIRTPKLLTAGLSVGRGKYEGEYLTMKTNEATQAHN